MPVRRMTPGHVTMRHACTSVLEHPPEIKFACAQQQRTPMLRRQGRKFAMQYRALAASGLICAAALAFVGIGPAQAQQPAAAAPDVKLGIVSFLTGPAAAPFGIPGRNAAEILIEALNSGKAPAPYNTPGLGGAKIEAKYVDEVGSTANQVTEYRNLVQRDNVDAVLGYVSSGSCLAVVPVAEELKTLTVLYDCGTPRIFEEAARKYVFRVTPHATMDSVGAALYVTHKIKDVST